MQFPPCVGAASCDDSMLGRTGGCMCSAVMGPTGGGACGVGADESCSDVLDSGCQKAHMDTAPLLEDTT